MRYMEDSDRRVCAVAIGARVLGPGLVAPAAAGAAGVGVDEGCGAVAGGRVDGGGRCGGGGWIQGDAAGVVRATEVATGAFAPLASAVVVAGYRGTLQGVSGPLRWLRELLHPLPAQWWWPDTGGRCRGCQGH
jgi:hypothetical protein